MKHELYQTVSEFRGGILGDSPSALMCRAICLPLQGYLSFAMDIKTTLGEGAIWNDDCEIFHTWLVLPDGSIIDPTADQFTAPDGKRMPPVYIGERPKWYLAD